jgi:6-pyruvoyltetrahydropterin/6-carboxytetrahydropterin synthase
MYKIEKKFTVPIGHRLSKNKGLCKNIHGHNFTVLVCVKCEKLDENDMVMDFSDLKNLVNEELNRFDHCLLLNSTDSALARDLRLKVCDKILEFPYDPTAERLSEYLYNIIDNKLEGISSQISVDYVIVYENENSKAIYSRN